MWFIFHYSGLYRLPQHLTLEDLQGTCSDTMISEDTSQKNFKSEIYFWQHNGKFVFSLSYVLAWWGLFYANNMLKLRKSIHGDFHGVTAELQTPETGVLSPLPNVQN